MKFRKLIAGLAVICAICYSGTALAAGPEETAETATQETTRTMAVSVEDITAVLEQLTEYEEEVEMLAQLVYAEARGVGSKAEQAAVVWCVLNRAVGVSDGTLRRWLTPGRNSPTRPGCPWTKNASASLRT
jgi:hypothetical protein